MRSAMPETNAITPKQASHPANIIQIIIQSGLPLNSASAAPTNPEAPIIPVARTIFVRPSLRFSNLFLAALGFLSDWVGSSCCASARATVSRLVPQARQNLAPSRFCVAHRGQYIVTLRKTCTRRPQHEVSEIPSNHLIGIVGN